MLHRTVPVLCDGDAVDQVGTGTLFDLDGRLFFVTAGHIFDDIKPQNLSLPTNPMSSDLQTLGAHTLYRPREIHIDIAVLELLEHTIVEKLRAGWHVLTLANIAPCAEQATFVICGYPSCLVRRRGERLTGTLISAYTERFRGIPPNAKKPVDPNLDLFFHYDHSADDVFGNEIATPHLGGTSGSSVWQYIEPPADRFWSVDKSLKVVGIQAAFVEGEYARAVNWTYVFDAFQQIDPKLTVPVFP